MPEIPDLEAFSRNLSRHLKGATLESIKAHKRAKSDPSIASINKALKGLKLKRIYREGKQLRFDFGENKLLGIHLMLHGEFRWEEKKKPTYVVFTFNYQGKPALWLTDFHFQAHIFLNPALSEAPDVLDKKANFKFWKTTLDSEKVIKTLLMDQDTVRGMGNAYTDEILYEAGIAPWSASSKIPDAQIKKLMKVIPKVHRNASKMIDKNDPEVIGGEYRAFMKVHNSKKEKTDSGFRIKKKSIGGRKTYFTDEQVAYK